ncbi:hypothetical protein HOU03_gp255 [Caulobacter phage CcrSC]|uniref:Uncharacterized protein n=1 Tax=Caulobacter phage CcrSC TaxID=2283272 RepID=A0A385EE13_9CAUD|nr:hypothetical protein HOU03_gp255 [Caulobacter phage CcrSC]AXQ70013.1 hypothetical protein CcrSC_gp431 [Caulobacter phage CcrSC]
MKLTVTTVESVEAWGDTLSLVKVKGIDKTVVANRKEDDSFRWTVGEPVVYVPENAILPEEVLKARGYWDEVKNKGLLGGSKGNRVKNRVFGRTEDNPGVESSGLLFKVAIEQGYEWFVIGGALGNKRVFEGDDVAEFLGVTEYVA